MTKLLFYIIIFILAAFVGLLVDHYLHSPGIWHCLMGIEFCGNGIFPERESRGLTLPIFPDGVPLVAGIKCFWTESHGFKNAAENARESQDPPRPLLIPPPPRHRKSRLRKDLQEGPNK